MKKIIYILIIIIASGLILGGLWLFRETIFVKEVKKKEVAEEKIGVGITFIDPESIASYQAIIDYLNKYSDHQWYLVPLKDYGAFITQMKLGQIKAGFMGSAVAYRMLKENLALPVSRAEKDGVSVYYGYIFTRKESGLNTIEDLKDKKFAYVDIYTSAGYLFPRYLLKTKGYDPENFFGVSSFLGSHKNAILAVFKGQYDGGAAKDSSWKKLALENHDLEKELQIIATEGPFPEQTFMVGSEFGEKEVQELRYLFLKMNESEEGRAYLTKFKADRFIITKPEDFQTAAKIFNP